jgi:hypothetical protein
LWARDDRTPAVLQDGDHDVNAFGTVLDFTHP